MKLYIPQIDYLVEFKAKTYQTLVIENPRLLCRILNDIAEQLQGNEGQIVLSKDNKVISIEKNIEMISQFIPFEMNKRSLLTKITNHIQQLAIGDKYYLQTTTLVTEWERLLLNLSMDMIGNLNFTKISVEALIRASGIELDETYDNLGEKLLDYFELVQEYEQRKIFVLVNLRSYMSNSDMLEFFKGIGERQYYILFIESIDYQTLPVEEKHIIDAEQCILC